MRNEAELLIPHVAGGVYYRDIAREKAKIRNSVEEHNKTPVTSRLRQTHHVKRVRRARRPPSVKPRTVKKLKQALNVLRDTQQMAEKKAYIQVILNTAALCRSKERVQGLVSRALCCSPSVSVI